MADSGFADTIRSAAREKALKALGPRYFMPNAFNPQGEEYAHDLQPARVYVAQLEAENVRLAAVLETTRETLATLWHAERGARMQALLGNDGDAAAIRREAIWSALGLKLGEAMPYEPPPRLSALFAEDATLPASYQGETE